MICYVALLPRRNKTKNKEANASPVLPKSLPIVNSMPYFVIAPVSVYVTMLGAKFISV